MYYAKLYTKIIPKIRIVILILNSLQMKLNKTKKMIIKVLIYMIWRIWYKAVIIILIVKMIYNIQMKKII